MRVEIVAFEDKYYEQVRDLELKEADKKEVEASNGFPFRRTVIRTLNTHKDSMYLILYKGTVSGIFGVVPSGKPGTGIGYLLTDDRLREYRWDMARYSLEVFRHLLKDWWKITNYVSSEHKVSLLWLKKLGARFDGKVYLLHDQEVPFYKFELRKEDYYDIDLNL
ncbi:MAG: hypothetical protein NZ811_07155 [Gammaproteobacteria bacterium]|nr:hypothetical protein [Gammaproteobacteria bacterium]